MDKDKLLNKLSNYEEMLPNSHDGSYELMITTIGCYENCSFDTLNYNDLNLVYLMSVGTWKHGFEQKEKCIEFSNLSTEKKVYLKDTLNRIKAAAAEGKYENQERPGSVGLFGTGFYSFLGKTDDESVRRFIKLCVDILYMRDDEAIYDITEQVLSLKIKGMQAGAASMVLHCLKPFTFPILNGVMKKDNAYAVLGIDLKKTGELSEYISNCRKIKAYRDANFKFRNYRIFDLQAWSQEDNNNEEFLSLIQAYKDDFAARNKEERYKWEAIKHYKDHWNIDAPDFEEMVKKAFAKTFNLLAAGQYYARKMVEYFSEKHPEEVRELFKILYDESLPLAQRFDDFRSGFEVFAAEEKLNHYQDLHAISVYLTLEYPEKYYIYKYGVLYDFAYNHSIKLPKTTGKHETFKIECSNKLCDDILNVVSKDEELLEMSRARLDETCYADPAYHMLAFDIMFFGSYYSGWWPSKEEYDPKLTKEDWKNYILEVEKPNHPSVMSMLKAMMELGGEASCKELSEKYGGHPSAYIGCTTSLGRRVKSHFDLPPCMEDEKERYFPIPFVGKQRGEHYIFRIRKNLREALKEIDLKDVSAHYEEGDEMNVINQPKNMILYGPPGTGKTYHTACYAVAIIESRPVDEVTQEDYKEVFKRYTEYKNDGLVNFVTFHQSYGYEEFIEGIKPVTEQGDEEKSDIRYSVENGVFKNFCEKAARPILKKQDQEIGLNKSPTIWKVSLEGTGDNQTRSECMKNGHIRIGYDVYGPEITQDTNFNEGGKTVVNALIYKMRKGDIIFSCYSASTIDAIGVVTGDYEWHDEYDQYKRLRKVNWIVKGIQEDIVDINNGMQMTLSSVYKLSVSLDDAMTLIQKYAVTTEEEKKNHVFIIDEINRGNISKIFGELITLIEDSKRIGAEEELKVALPYSQKLFGIPENVYILGTMNTADRSIAALDTALRRRFSFVEMMPDSSLLDGVSVDGVDVGKMLKKMNERIAVLFDREHTIGHAYFIKLKNNPTLEVLSDIFKNKIIPLLQEYFYEDYEKIRLVLADNQVAENEKQFIIAEPVNAAALFGNSDVELLDDTVRYSINSAAFENAEAYSKIYQ